MRVCGCVSLVNLISTAWLITHWARVRLQIRWKGEERRGEGAEGAGVTCGEGGEELIRMD